jgi:hypothetical protein
MLLGTDAKRVNSGLLNLGSLTFGARQFFVWGDAILLL